MAGAAYIKKRVLASFLAEFVKTRFPVYSEKAECDE
jgi:hypothetical protein